LAENLIIEFWLWILLLSVYGKSLFEETHASMVACQVYDILKG
jgi:hypothetical protein